jgi:hypothetical protein
MIHSQQLTSLHNFGRCGIDQWGPPPIVTNPRDERHPEENVLCHRPVLHRHAEVPKSLTFSPEVDSKLQKLDNELQHSQAVEQVAKQAA